MYTYISKNKQGELSALEKGGFPGQTRVILEHNQALLGPTLLKQFGRAVACAGPLGVALDITAAPRAIPKPYIEALDADGRNKLSIVVTPKSSPHLLKAARFQCSKTGLAVIRIKPQPTPALTLKMVMHCVNDLDVPMNQVAVILDFATLEDMTVTAAGGLFASHAAPLFDVGDFESVTVASTSFPKGIGSLPQGWSHLLRTEINQWVSARHQSGLPICFGDYGPRSSDFPPGGFANTLAQVRYTCSNSYLVYRGKPLRTGHNQHVEIGKALVGMDQYRGTEFSWGDEEIQRIAQQERGPGNRSTWVSIETSHHLVLTAEQVSWES